MVHITEVSNLPPALNDDAGNWNIEDVSMQDLGHFFDRFGGIR